MKKKLLTILTTLTLVCALFLNGCGINQNMADKINDKAKSEEGYTYTQLLEDYKDPTVDFTATVLGVTSGTVIYVEGCKTLEEVEEKVEAGKKLKAVYVTIVASKVTVAKFAEYSSDEE